VGDQGGTPPRGAQGEAMTCLSTSEYALLTRLLSKLAQARLSTYAVEDPLVVVAITDSFRDALVSIIARLLREAHS
jgi:hypothetical protein